MCWWGHAKFLMQQVCKNIRIFHGWEVQIENSVKRVTVWHYENAEWCQPVIPAQCQNSEFALNNHYDARPSTIAFKHLYPLFNQNYAEISAFSVKKCAAWLTDIATLTSKALAENDLKKLTHNIKKTAWHHAQEWCKTTFPCTKFLSGMQEKLTIKCAAVSLLQVTLQENLWSVKHNLTDKKVHYI